MLQKQDQMKIAVPFKVKKFAKSKAQKYGLTLAGYIRYLLINEMRKEDYPVYEASDKLKKVAKEAVRDFSKGIVVDDIDKFFDKL